MFSQIFSIFSFLKLFDNNFDRRFTGCDIFFKIYQNIQMFHSLVGFFSFSPGRIKRGGNKIIIQWFQPLVSLGVNNEAGLNPPTRLASG